MVGGLVEFLRQLVEHVLALVDKLAAYFYFGMEPPLLLLLIPLPPQLAVPDVPLE